MTAPQVEKEKDLLAAKFAAEVKEADARLKVLQAQAEARKARADMDEISGLAAARERVKQDVANLKQKASTDYAAAKSAVEKEIKDLQADIQRVSDRYTAWDAAREREFNARLDEAEAQLGVWKAKADQKQAQHAVKRHDELAALEEKIALARARSAEAKHQKYTTKAQEALNDAARHFDRAYDAAAKRYEKS
jgi:phage shock protein A